MTDAGANPRLNAFWDSYFALRPVNATFTGLHDYDHRLPDWSPDGLSQALQDMKVVDAGLRSVGSDRNGDEGLAASFLEIQIAEMESEHFQRANPSLHLGEAIFGIVGLMLRDFAPAEERTGNIIARLGTWNWFLANVRHSVRAHSVPASWVERTVRECHGAADLLQHGIETWAAGRDLSKVQQRELTAATRHAADALQAFLAWLEGAAAGDSPGRCGPQHFDLLLREGHRVETDRATLNETARGQLDIAERQLTTMSSRLDANGWAGVRERLAMRHPSASEYLSTFDTVWRDCRDVVVSLDLCAWPDFPIQYRAMPNWAQTAAPYLYFLYYRSPPPFDDLPIHAYLVPPAASEAALRATNVNVIKQNHVVHHGGIGHHVQNYFAYRSNSAIGRVAAVDCATRIGMFCGGTMAEGWACYATDLMEEVGFFSDMERASLQENRVKQLVRAVVDIEFHQGTMTFEQGERLFIERAGASPVGARSEMTKISMFPGTGMMYWYGTKRIHEMRTEKANALRDAFSLRQFHEDILSHGSLPVDVIAAGLVEGGVS